MKNVVIFNGGRGAGTIIPALIENDDVKLSSIVNAYDDGKSTGEIRAFFEMLGPSDIRKVQQLLVPADHVDFNSIDVIYDLRFPKTKSNNQIFKLLENESKKKSRIFFGETFNNQYMLDRLRFFLKIFVKNYLLIAKSFPQKKLILKDCSLMNCLYAGAFLHFKRNIDHATLEFEKLFNLSGSVLPTSIENKKLVGLRSNGDILFSEAEIVELRSNVAIERVYLLESYPPKGSFKNVSFQDKKYYFETHQSFVEASPRVQRAVDDADIIIYAAGTQHSSLYPTYLSNGIASSIAKNKRAFKVFITNIGADYETPFYRAHDYINGALKYLNLANDYQGEYSDYFNLLLVNKSQAPSNKNSVRIHGPSLKKIPIKKLAKNFELAQTGKHNGSLVVKEIMRHYSQYLSMIT